MKTIITITEQDIVPDAPVVDVGNFKTREAARAVVLDDDGKVALLHVGLHKYHKLPGGGIDSGEDVTTALERELMEEIGCEAEVELEIGQTVEQRDQFQLLQTSYCFVAAKVGETVDPSFTEEELQEQFSIIWADSLDQAISLVEKDDPQNYEGKFIKKRDLAILNAAKDLTQDYSPTEKDIDSVLSYLKVNDPENATAEKAVALLEELQTGFDKLEVVNPELLDRYYEKLRSKI